MTVSGPYRVEKPPGKRRTGELYWQVTVRTGDVIQTHRFADEAKATAYAAAINPTTTGEAA